MHDTIALAAAMYVRTPVLFVTDALSALPLELCLLPAGHAAFSYALLRHLLRIPRLYTLLTSGNPMVVRRPVLEFLFVLSVATVAACAIAAAFIYAEPTVNTLEAMYFVFATVLTVGYGDVVPVTPSGRYVAMGGMVLGLATVSSVTAMATALATRKDRLHQDLDDRKLLMSSMMAHYHVPWQLQKEIIALFPTMLDAYSDSAFEAMLTGLPKAHRLKLEGYSRLRYLKTVPLFDSLGDDDALRVARCLTQVFAAAGELIIAQGEEGHEMYFLIRGAVEVYLQDPATGDSVVLKQLRDGSYFGEIALVSNKPRGANVAALCVTELLVLSEADFSQIELAFPTIFQDLRATLQQRDRLAAQAVVVPATPTAPDSPVQATDRGQEVGATPPAATDPPAIPDDDGGGLGGAEEVEEPAPSLPHPLAAPPS